MLKDFKPRPYQESIYKTAKDKNTLVVLPTGLGKTAISMLLTKSRLETYPESKILFLAPTKPLVEQQRDSFKKIFDNEKEFAVFTGAISPTKRHELWSKSQIIFSTPQTIENDIMGGKINLSEVSLLVIDEAHRARGNYAYVFIAKNYMQTSKQPRILALTASPGTNKESLEELVKNLSIETIEYREPGHHELMEFTKETDVVWEQIELSPEIKKILFLLNKSLKERIKRINEIKEIPIKETESKSKLLQLQAMLQKRISQGDTNPEVFVAVSLVAELVKIQHAQELAETQTLYALHEYLYNILVQARKGKTKSSQNLARDPNILEALAIVRELRKKNTEHPKFQKLIDQVLIRTHNKQNIKIIIFTQFRDTALQIEKTLNQVIPSRIFFGQAKKNGIGFSQKQQKETITDFRNGKFTCLIATSVAEEGLDIPNVDHVFFYEPIPSAIRSVQRRGRTGRQSKGYVTVFVAKGTRDETFRWVAHHKEKRMYSLIKEFSQKNKQALFETGEQRRIAQFVKEENKSHDKERKKELPRIVADYREKGSPVLKNLLEEHIELQLKHLEVGDFILSKECAVEFKNISDFVDSIVDGRLLSQIRSLIQYPKPILILEGDEEDLYHRRVHREAIQGMIATITTSYRIPIIRTFSPRETAQILIAIAKREQDPQDKSFSYHNAKPLIEKDLMEYIVSSLPTIGPSLAKALLEKFDSIEKIFSAKIEELKKNTFNR